MFAINVHPAVLTLYSLGAITQACASLGRNKFCAWLAPFLGVLAVAFHGLLLYQWIDLPNGQNLADFNLLSLAIWLTAIFILAFRLFRPVGYLNIFIYPLAVVSVVLVSQFPSSHIVQTSNDLKQCAHILLSIITFSVLFLAGIQAVSLAIQDRFLKQKYLAISGVLPPIETMEKSLFETLAIGVLLLSLVLLSSLLFFHSVMFSLFLQKTVLTFLAWLIFGCLLVGRYYFGWRGRKAIYFTLGGLGVMSSLYFGSIIIMELTP